MITHYYSDWIPKLLDVAKQACLAIAEVFQNNAYRINMKLDNTPVTEADFLSQEIIKKGLAEIDPQIPMISEESDAPDFTVRSKWSRLWLVDPLDGTKEFIRGNKEFTVNIALIEENKPVLGVVAVPLLEHYYWAVSENKRTEGAFFKDGNGKIQQIYSENKLRFPIRVALSKSALHQNNLSNLEKLETLLKRLKDYEILYSGSALKICLVAQGEIDLYPRFGKTGEWDTAAGQCILEAAGGQLVDLSGQALKYNARPTLINPAFYAVSCVDLLSYVVDKSL